MTKMSEIYNKDFNIAIIEMLEWAILDTFETSEKTESKERDGKKNQMKISKPNNVITNFFNSMDRLNHNWTERIEERISEDKAIETLQPEQQRESGPLHKDERVESGRRHSNPNGCAPNKSSKHMQSQT